MPRVSSGRWYGGSPKQSPPEISVLIPCLNEEAAVADVVDEAWEGIHSSGRTGQVIVIDNASTDRSAEIAAEHVGLVIEGTDARRQNVLSAFWWGAGRGPELGIRARGRRHRRARVSLLLDRLPLR
jgi:glycosyltransferase involved in cell wall biosynthesis